MHNIPEITAVIKALVKGRDLDQLERLQEASVVGPRGTYGSHYGFWCFYLRTVNNFKLEHDISFSENSVYTETDGRTGLM